MEDDVVDAALPIANAALNGVIQILGFMLDQNLLKSEYISMISDAMIAPLDHPYFAENGNVARAREQIGEEMAKVRRVLGD